MFIYLTHTYLQYIKHIHAYMYVLHTHIFYINLSDVFFLKEVCTAHKHQSFHFKSECEKVEYCLVRLRHLIHFHLTILIIFDVSTSN